MGRGRVLTTLDLQPSYALVRAAGLPFAAVDELCPGAACELAHELELLSATLRGLSGPLCERLFAAVHGRAGTTERRALLELKRCVYNARAPRTEAKLRQTLAIIEADDPGLAAEVRSWHVLVTRFQALTASGEAVLAADLAGARRRLRALWELPEVQTGILFAQPSLFDRLSARDGTGDAQWPEKLTAAAARYCYRMGTKTSPFSTFTTTAICRLAGESDSDHVLTGGYVSSFGLNPAVIDVLAARIRQVPSIACELPLLVNPTAEAVGDEIAFVTAQRAGDESTSFRLTVERWQWIRRNPVVDVTLEILSRDRDSTIASLRSALTDGVSDLSVRDRITDALERLVEIGLLQLSLDYDARSPRALAQLAACDALSRSEAGARVQHQLSRVLASTEELNGAPPVIQRQLVRAIHGQLATTFAALGGVPDGLDEQGMLHHDVTTAASPFGRLDSDVINSLRDIHRVLPAFNVEHPYRDRVQRFAFERVSAVDDGASIIDLYREFCTAATEEGPPGNAEMYRVQQAIARDLLAVATRNPTAPATVSEDELLGFGEQADRYRIPGIPMSVGFFGQLWQADDAAERFVINRLVPGYGTVTARAAADRGGDSDRAWLAEALRSDRPGAEDSEFVDLTGTFGFGGQVAPQISARRIAYPTEPVRHRLNAPLSLADVRARIDPSLDAVRLWHRRSKRWLVPVASGTLAPGLFPPFFRFLMSFGPACFPDMPLIELFEQAQRSPAQRLRRYSRLTYKSAVLHRETWCLPAHAIPPLPPGGRRARFADFQRLQKWAGDLGLPQRVFVSLARPRELAGPRRAAGLRKLQKPFYVDWDDALSHQIFRHLSRDTDATLTISEMLPDPLGLFRDPANPARVLEHFVEITEP